ncbi:MAG: DUF1285 domain-containing protein [Alphaproteobacteria bacterium]|nr:MAG: DUF1285 domain-containing protein [Alphaproteobacteria bacterium]
MNDRPAARVQDRRLLAGLGAIVKQIGDQRYPPVDKWDPAFCGDIDIHILRDGRWLYRGSPITRQPLVKLFASVLRRDVQKGPYFLVTPAEKLAIRVDVAPLLAVEATISGAGRDQVIALRTNVDDFVIVDAEHPLWVEQDRQSGEPVPLVRVRGLIDALLTRAVFYELAGIAEPKAPDGPLGVWSSGQFFALGHADDA